ncbi:tRNA (N(6)-L-threonylcarbamoyladenosine(37)-C(2))-methylthiotransferase MtaB [Salipiger bermudensis]|uniref:tRNA (N(6)-L-threonylcarbamoyladenosine(37)-C(2))- methylthiotransferase MtaB n=1 Tax=Salipiger bermudensis TaxID=344736 RepID=UPI001CD8169E|nr:tRNA (N(6)-L-threonylcarbamoyladenosine(37)-C(2))-methylthiotransferase MtaB [Salipiger bermudensis]MCA0964451.1 tRNA (N(6)-L-threonylcarbamoyladenosine(37)-C(2))-methylthiotransferase MtaB [Salipiger bermudensis]
MSAPKFTTLGCRLNAYETEAMKALAEEAGVGDAVVVNTCAVTAEAVRKARQEIRRLRRENPEARVIVTGCAAQIDPDSFAAMDEVDAVIGNTEKMSPDTWAGLSNGFIGETEKVQVNDIMSVTETAGHLIDGFGTRSRAYVQVQNGCDHRCTFCIIPYGRGNSRSVPAGVVVDQIKRLVQKGFNEVVLTGVDLTSWGADLPGAPRLGDLVMRILRLTDVPRLRISSIDSIEADDNLMLAIASEPRLMPHLHLSLQHGDDLILKRMKRRHLRDDAIRFTEEARRLRPDITFGADIIAGFPTETEAHFENSLKLVEECDLTWLHVFPYSSRPGTPAAKIPSKVDGNTIKGRAARLRAAGEAAVARHLAAQQGVTHRILMENPTMGRTEQFTEVDLSTPQAEGAIVTATITGRQGQRLVA